MTTKLPLKLIFAITSALLFLMAIKFVGDAIQYLQDARHVPATPIDGLGGLLRFGLSPTWEAVIAQLTVIMISLTTLAAFDRANRGKLLA